MRRANVTTASPLVCEPIEMPTTPELAGFAALFERHHEAVFRAALRVTGHRADAEDVLQTVFLRVLSQSNEAADRPAADFHRAAVNAAVDILRRRAAHAETPYDDLAPHATVERPMLLKEQLRRAIATLDTSDASLFLLRHVEGFSIEELAGLFQMQKNNVTVKLHRIRLRLQGEMER